MPLHGEPTFTITTGRSLTTSVFTSMPSTMSSTTSSAPAHTTSGIPTVCRPEEYLRPGRENALVQLVISAALGIFAFTVFCILRPRWKSLYQARKRNRDPESKLPTLPDGFLSWIPVLYRVTDNQILVSAGLDAYVFLKFFKVSIRLFSVMLFFAATILWPLNHHFWGSYDLPSDPGNGNHTLSAVWFPIERFGGDDGDGKPKMPEIKDPSFFWSYLVFTWFFTLLTIYYFNSESFRINKVRQDYLGSQITVTDRTFRLTGIPKKYREETKIKKLVERLQIGRVENVTLCCHWEELDALLAQRMTVLRRLEESWAEYLRTKPQKGTTRRQAGRQRVDEETGAAAENSGPEGSNDETNHLLPGGSNLVEVDDNRPRPTVRVWHGFLYLQWRQTDAIDYYEERLRRLDEQIGRARHKKYRPADLAFVTMDSTAACQMAIQALLGPTPGQLLTKPASAPSDVMWKNTYKSRLERRLRGWSVTVLVSLLSLLWLIPVASLASLVSICTIRKIAPGFAERLQGHFILTALVQTGLPTIVVSLLNIAVPYLYEWLSYRQGVVSLGDIELSMISKNFFFTFFNIFFVFAVSGTATGFWGILKDVAKDTSSLPPLLAKQIIGLNSFYLNFIMLQGIGLIPFKLLDFGNAVLYPLYRYWAKTPRELEQLHKPSTFSYGYYLPTSLLIFILCLIYSVLPMSHLVLTVGVIYFTLGYFAYKYQLLYAMEQPQHATGGAWRIICYRVILGLVVFQLVMTGILALLGSYEQSILVTPLILLTVWYGYYWKSRFEPLTMFIALKSLRAEELQAAANAAAANGEVQEGSGVANDNRGGSEDGDGDSGQDHEEPDARELFRRGNTLDETREQGLKFINPSLVGRLERPWIYGEKPIPLPLGDESENEYLGRGTAPASGARTAGAGLGIGPGEADEAGWGEYSEHRRLDLRYVDNDDNIQRRLADNTYAYGGGFSSGTSSGVRPGPEPGCGAGAGVGASLDSGSNASQTSLGDTHIWRQNTNLGDAAED